MNIGIGHSLPVEVIVTEQLGHQPWLYSEGFWHIFYASTLSCQRYCVFGWFVCPSVRLKPKIPSFHLHMGLLVHPTNHDHFSACLSVHLERFLSISRRTHGGNGLKFCMLMYPDDLQNWLDYGHGLLIFLLLAPLDRSYLGFPGIVWRMLGSKCRGASGGIFVMLCVELCLVSFVCSLQFPLLQSKIHWIIGWFSLNHVYPYIYL